MLGQVDRGVDGLGDHSVCIDQRAPIVMIVSSSELIVVQALLANVRGWNLRIWVDAL